MKSSRVGFFVLVGLITFTFIAIAVVMKRPGSGGGATIPEPISYAKPTPGGQFLFVSHGKADAEQALKPGSMKSSAENVRKTYSTPGMYTNTEPRKLVYPIDGYAPDENVYLTKDGRCVVRIEGDWWTEKAYPAGTRLDAAREQELLNSPALSIYVDGKLMKQYKLAELVRHPGDLPHSPKFILWPAGAGLNEETRRFFLLTQDTQRITFDIDSGEIVTSESMGFGSRSAQITITVVLALTVLTAMTWLWFVFRKRRTKPSVDDQRNSTGSGFTPNAPA